MSPEITHIRSEDLLDDSAPRRVARRLGVGRRRQVIGLVLALIALPLATLGLEAVDEHLALDAEALIYLFVVVLVALVGGVGPALVSSVASALLINYFFVDPVHTLSIADPDQAVALAVFVAVAALVSGAVEIAERRTQAAERARAEAETLSELAGPKLDEEDSLHDVLRHARETFGMETVTLKVRPPSSSEWVDADRAGWGPPGDEAPIQFDVPAGPRLRLVGRGPALFAEDERVLEAFAAAARTAYEGQRLSDQAKEARSLVTVDEQRRALLSAVGHDLRTPLAGIKAGVSSLRQTDVQLPEAERRELLETIEESADRLDAVVRNLLDASRLQSGALVTRPEAVALDQVVSSALLELPEASAQVEVNVPEDLPLIRADPGLLQRVFVNVIDNALRYGQSEEPVSVNAHAGSDTAKIEVVDHGRGISEELRGRLFEPFQSTGDRNGHGLGLGLSVARGFVEAMGGAMVADHTPGGGMTMRIRLPLQSASRKHSEEAG